MNEHDKRVFLAAAEAHWGKGGMWYRRRLEEAQAFSTPMIKFAEVLIEYTRLDERGCSGQHHAPTCTPEHPLCTDLHDVEPG